MMTAGVLRVSGGAAPDTVPERPVAPAPHGGREMALTMLREALAYHEARANDYRRLLEEIERG